MSPILLRLGLPELSLPLAPTLVVLGLIALGTSAIGFWKRDHELAFFGCAAGVGALLGASWGRDQLAPLGPVVVPSYGAMLVVALLLGGQLARVLGARSGIPWTRSTKLLIVTAIGGLFGARLLYLLSQLPVRPTLASALDFGEGGLSSYGALLGGGLACWVRLRREPWLGRAWADAAAPAVALGAAVTHVGTYLSGSAFGRPLGAASPRLLARLGTFPHWPDATLLGDGSPAWVHHVEQGLVGFDAEASLPVHPVQLYAALAALVVFGALMFSRRRRLPPGAVALLGAFFYGAVRFTLDVLRDDPERAPLGPHFSEHSVVAVCLLVLAAAWVYGPSFAIRRPRWRWTSWGAALILVGLAYVAFEPAGSHPNVARLAASQWLALLTALAAAAAWSRLEPGVLASAGPASDADDRPDRSENPGDST